MFCPYCKSSEVSLFIKEDYSEYISYLNKNIKYYDKYECNNCNEYFLA